MQNRRTVAIVAAVALAVVIGLLVRSRTTGSPEAQVRAVIQQMVDAANDRDVGGVLDHITTSYRGTGDHELDRQRLRELLLVRLVRGGGGTVRWVEEALQVTSKTHATVQLGLEAGGGSRYDIRVDLEKADDAWRVVSSHHRSSALQAPPSH